MRRYAIAAAGAAVVFTFNPFTVPEGLAQQVRVVPTQPMSIVYGGANRAVMGITLATVGRNDTLGVRVDEVDPNGPAAKAGIKSGMIITAINDVSLRVSPADAADNELMGLAQRRLTRTLQKAKAGDEVELRVLDGSQSRTVRVKTIAASELQHVAEPARGTVTRATTMNSDRPVLGASIGMSGSPRDTLGLFVNSVVTNGPADKAGIIEGQRIAAINGVDLRVSREDLEDSPARMSRVTRFNRELQKGKAGDRVTLRVWSDGRYRDVSVTPVKASELPNRGFQMTIGDGAFSFSVPEGMPRLEGFGRDGKDPMIFRYDSEPFRMQLDGPDREKLEKAMEELRTNLRMLPDRIRMEVAPRIRIETDSPASRQPTLVRKKA